MDHPKAFGYEVQGETIEGFKEGSDIIQFVVFKNSPGCSLNSGLWRALTEVGRSAEAVVSGER